MAEGSAAFRQISSTAGRCAIRRTRQHCDSTLNWRRIADLPDAGAAKHPQAPTFWVVCLVAEIEFGELPVPVIRGAVQAGLHSVQAAAILIRKKAAMPIHHRAQSTTPASSAAAGRSSGQSCPERTKPRSMARQFIIANPPEKSQFIDRLVWAKTAKYGFMQAVTGCSPVYVADDHIRE